MTKVYGLYTFPNTSAADAYEADDGRLATLGNNFVAPPDIDAAGITSIVNSVAGAVERFTGDKTFCPQDSIKSPRKITYTRSNGSTLSLVVPIRVGTGIADAISANVAAIEAAGQFPVICASLEGEEVTDMYDTYVPAAKLTIAPAAIGNRPLPIAGIQYLFTGVQPYQIDFDPLGRIVLKPFKIFSNLDDLTPTLFGAALAAVPFELLNTPLAACSAGDKREPRHFIVTNAIGATLATAVGQETKLPVAGSTNANIITAATTLATLGSTYCLDYKGESNPRLWRS